MPAGLASQDPSEDSVQEASADFVEAALAECMQAALAAECMEAVAEDIDRKQSGFSPTNLTLRSA